MEVGDACGNFVSGHWHCAGAVCRHLEESSDDFHGVHWDWLGVGRAE